MKEKLAKLDRPWRIAASWISTLLVPLVLLFVAVRIVASSFFLDLEYRLPNFPEDPYGFTLEQRLQYSNLCLQYLTTEEDITLLGELYFDDGSPLFTQSELSHMEDVKAVFQPVIRLGFGITLMLFGFLLLAQRRPWRKDVISGIQRGGWLALSLIVMIGIFATIDFWSFFERFHAILFKGDSWLFLYSDTLIRLFPLRFWQDAVIFLAILVGGGGLLLGIFLRRKRKPVAN